MAGSGSISSPKPDSVHVAIPDPPEVVVDSRSSPRPLQPFAKDCHDCHDVAACARYEPAAGTGWPRYAGRTARFLPPAGELTPRTTPAAADGLRLPRHHEGA